MQEDKERNRRRDGEQGEEIMKVMEGVNGKGIEKVREGRK